nr:hypothetical protein [Hasllibacter halocynthiae]
MPWRGRRRNAGPAAADGPRGDPGGARRAASPPAAEAGGTGPARGHVRTPRSGGAEAASPDGDAECAGIRPGSTVAQAILARLADAPADEDQLIRASGACPGEVAPALLALELDGRIERRAGGRIHLS